MHLGKKAIFLIVVLGVLSVPGAYFFGAEFLKGFESPPLIHPRVLLNPPDAVSAIPAVTERDHVWGSREAPVLVINYSDPECPFCKANYWTMKSLVHAYGGDIAMVYRHNTLDHRFTKSKTEAIASECAASVGGEGAFWLFLDKIYEETGSRDSLDLDLLPVFAQEIGINMERFNKCLANSETSGRVEEDKQGARRGGLQYTPSMVVFWPDDKQRSFIIGSRGEETLRAVFNYILGRESSAEDSARDDSADEPQFSR